MSNGVDKSYQELLKRVLSEGKLRGDRTGTGTISIFSHTLEMDMTDGFPLLTTKKMFTNGVIHELLWFLNGDTNIQYLVQNGVNIWTPDAYRGYVHYFDGALENGVTMLNNEFKSNNPHEAIKLTKEQFSENIKTDNVFAKKWGELGPVYGKQWVGWGSYEDRDDYVQNGSVTSPNIIKVKRTWSGINQIEQVIDKLKNKPEDRRIMVSAWNVAEIDKMALPPCHWAFELYTEELTHDERFEIYKDANVGGRVLQDHITAINFKQFHFDEANIPSRRLSLKWHQRSVDTFLGLPFNIASYALLLHMFAQQTNMVVGTLVGDLTNVHIYKNHIEQCEEQISREPMELAKLELNKVDGIFSYTFDDIKIMDYKSHPPIKGEISV